MMVSPHIVCCLLFGYRIAYGFLDFYPFIIMTGAAMDTQLGVEDLRDHRSSRKTIAARPRLTLNKQGTEQIGTLYLGTTID